MATPLGNFDTATPTNGCTGWALSPDNPNTNLAIHFYANAPAGSPNSVLIGNTIANIPRPDVNKATGYPGNHGFNWSFPFDLITPCQVEVYAYAIDPDGGTNPLLHGSPILVPLLTGTISNSGEQIPIVITASSRFAGAINSLTWNGFQFIYANDHGQELQSAINSQSSPNSWPPECYNPTEAGSYADSTSTCTSSHLLALSLGGAQLNTQTNMAFWANPSTGSGTCITPKNTTILSGVILTKTVTLAFNANIPQAIKYEVSFQFPSNYAYPELNLFEVIAWYMPNSGSNEFNTFLQYNQSTGSNTDVTATVMAAGSSGVGTINPVILANGAGGYAAGIYCPLVTPSSTIGYDQYYYGNTNKIGCIQRINPITPGNTYSFTAYLVVGTAAVVRESLGSLITAYPN